MEKVTYGRLGGVSFASGTAWKTSAPSVSDGNGGNAENSSETPVDVLEDFN